MQPAAKDLRESNRACRCALTSSGRMKVKGNKSQAIDLFFVGERALCFGKPPAANRLNFLAVLQN